MLAEDLGHTRPGRHFPSPESSRSKSLPVLPSVEQPEMSKLAVIWLLVDRPLFDFNQPIVGPFDFLQYLLCVGTSFAMRVAAQVSQLRDVVLQKQGSYVRDGRVVIFDVLGSESELGTVSPDGKSQWIWLYRAMQIRISGRRRSLDYFRELGLNAKVLTSVSHDESLDSAARWRAERHKINAQHCLRLSKK